MRRYGGSNIKIVEFEQFNSFFAFSKPINNKIVEFILKPLKNYWVENQWKVRCLTKFSIICNSCGLAFYPNTHKPTKKTYS